jgi:hypothetical protein
MARTTRTDLDSMARAIDDALHLPRGTHFVQDAYGGHALHRDGGSVDVTGYLSAGALLDWMRAYKRGIYHGRQALIAEVRSHPVASFDDYGSLRAPIAD